MKDRSKFILSDVACQICGKPSDIVCKECLAENRPACFCEKHKDFHRKIMPHIAFWGQLAEEPII